MLQIHIPIDVHTVAVLQGTEDYDTLRDGLSPVLQEINDLIAAKFIELDDGQIVELEFFLGGDYEVYKNSLSQLHVHHFNLLCSFSSYC